MEENLQISPAIKRAVIEVKSKVSLAEQVKAIYVDIAGYPPESLVSIYEGMELREVIASIVRRQFRMPFEDRRKLVKSKNSISERQMAQIDSFVKDNNIPYDSVYWIDGIGPYLSTEARDLLLKQSFRGYKDYELEDVSLEEKGPNPQATFKCRINFWDGSHIGWEYASCSAKELLEEKRRKDVTWHSVITMAQTRAFNRAAGRAATFTGSAIEAAELYDDGAPQVRQEVVIDSNGVDNDAKKVPESVAELLSMSLRNGANASKVAEIIGSDPRRLKKDELSVAWGRINKALGEIS